jgi:predicted PurR-regulated permease PerM
MAITAPRAARSSRAANRPLTGPQFDHMLTQAAQIAVVFIGALAFAAAMSLGKFVLAPISLAIVVGLMFGPVADAIERRGIAPALSAGLVVLLFLALLGIAGMLFAAPLAEWLQRWPLLWQRLQQQLATLEGPLQSLSSIQEEIKNVMGNDVVMTVAVDDGGPVQDAALMLPGVLADILLFLAGLYFYLATRHHIRLSVLSLCTSRRMRWRTAHIFRDVEAKVSRFLLSAAAINLGLGVATALTMWALGVPSPLLWGGLAAVLNFIPYIGQAIMLALLFIVGLGTHSDLLWVLLPVGAYSALNLVADQFVFPHLVGRAMTLNPFIIFATIAFWMWLWGPMGGFVAVPFLLVLQSIILNVFPSTAAIPKAVERRLANLAPKETAEAPDAEIVVPPAPKPRRARKAASSAAP